MRVWSWVGIAVIAGAACGGGQRVGKGGAALVDAALVDGGDDSGVDAAPSAETRSGTGTGTGTGTSGLAGMTREKVCRAAVTGRARVRNGIKPFEREDGTCAGNFCDVAERPPKGADACFVANSNIARAERESGGGGRRGGAAQSKSWDRKSTPQYFDRVDAHLHLDGAESSLLRANGFVVIDRLGYDSYAVAFHDVFQQQLPVYIGVDAIFNAVFQASQTVLGEVERTRLGPKLVTMIDRLRVALASARGRYDAATIDDLDLYLVVAHRLLHPQSEAKGRTPEVDAEVSSIVEQAKNGHQLTEVELFGRVRMVDFSQYVPRGHYANGGYNDGFDLKSRRPGSNFDEVEHISPSDYFLAMTWLSRLELNLVSRSCRSSQPGMVADPSETPREARDAIALADLLARSGVLADLRAFDDVYSVFAGGREDVPLSTIATLAVKGGFGPRDPEAPEKLRAAIGAGFKRTARTHFMPEAATELPAIATMFGPRIVPDIAPLTKLVHPAVPNRFALGAADVGYVLGHDRAKKYLAADLAKHPGLGAALEAGRGELASGARGKSDVYSAWLGAALHLADRPAGTTPSFMQTDAYADMRMSSALAVYAQIRHTFVLLAGQGYDGYGCEIPDGWVEPAVGAYEGMLSWVRAARTAAPSQAKYFRRVEEILSMLRAIAQSELAGAALSEPQRRWLGMVSEYTPKDGYGGDSGEPPKYTGWYFDLFPDREIGAERRVDLVADWFTLTNADQVRHLGIDNAAIGVFVVDTGGQPRVMVGPVAKTYEVATPIDGRLDDERARTADGKSAAWLSFLAPKKEDPDVAARLFACDDGARVVVESLRPASVAVTLLDHHGDPLGDAVTKNVDGEPAVFAFAVPAATAGARSAVEGMHLRVGGAGAPGARWDFVVGTSVYRHEAQTLPSVEGSSFDVAFGSMAANGARGASGFAKRAKGALPDP